MTGGGVLERPVVSGERLHRELVRGRRSAVPAEFINLINTCEVCVCVLEGWGVFLFSSPPGARPVHAPLRLSTNEEVFQSGGERPVAAFAPLSEPETSHPAFTSTTPAVLCFLLSPLLCVCVVLRAAGLQ